MLRHILMLAILSSTGAGAAPRRDLLASPKSPCERFGARHAQGAAPVAPRKLGELPPATRIAAVYREIDNCPSPIVLGPTKR